MKVIFVFLLGSLLGMSRYPAYAEDLASINLPKIKIMHDMSTQWVAEKIVYNAHPMSIQNFKSNKSAKEIISNYASRWKLKGHGQQITQQVGELLSIGYEDNGHNYSVQARDISGGSTGTLVVTRSRIFEQEPTHFPIYPDSQVISRIHSIDVGSRSETLTLSSNEISSISKQWYQSLLVRKGWISQSQLLADNSTLIYQKDKQLCQLIFIDGSPVPGHHSMVMIHWIKG